MAKYVVTVKVEVEADNADSASNHVFTILDLANLPWESNISDWEVTKTKEKK